MGSSSSAFRTCLRPGPKRQRTAAVQDASRGPVRRKPGRAWFHPRPDQFSIMPVYPEVGAVDPAPRGVREVLDCGSPLPLSEDRFGYKGAQAAQRPRSRWVHLPLPSAHACAPAQSGRGLPQSKTLRAALCAGNLGGRGSTRALINSLSCLYTPKSVRSIRPHAESARFWTAAVLCRFRRTGLATKGRKRHKGHDPDGFIFFRPSAPVRAPAQSGRGLPQSKTLRAALCAGNLGGRGSTRALINSRRGRAGYPKT